jgi:hypothetical protein
MDKDCFLKRLRINRPSVFEVYSYDFLPATFRSTDKISVNCFKHGIFNPIASNHLCVGGCPICARTNLTTEEFIFKSVSKFGNRFNYLKTNYVKQDIVLTITCEAHGDIELTPRNHFWCKHGCPKCDFEIPRAIKKQKLIDRAKEVHKNKYDYSRVVFVNGNDKVEILCPDHGSFWQPMFYHATKCIKCPDCSREEDKLSLDDFIFKSIALHGNKYDYSKVEYETNVSMITITCKKHGDFVQRAASHLAGCGCKKCFQEDSRLTTEEFIKNAKLVHGNNYDYSKVVYRGNKQLVEIICPTHGSFWQKPNTHVSSKNGCRFCFESKGERTIELFLKKYGINYIREYRLFPYLYRYDFYLPELNVFIEFNGLQHYKPVEFFGGLEGHLATKERDVIKKALVKQHSGNLIIIAYSEVTDNDSVEKQLIRRLKKICARWYKINGELKIFKTVGDAYAFFNIPSSTLIRNLDVEVKKVVNDFSVVF